MTLRFRLVVALLALAAIGLAVFGVTTYQLYARAQRDRLDEQLHSLVPLVSQSLHETLMDAIGATADHRPPGAGGHEVPIVVPPGTYAELRNIVPGDEAPVVTLAFADELDRPDLPDEVDDPGRDATRVLTVGSVEGSTDWRVLVQRSPDLPDHLLVVAIPTAEVTRALNRLLVIETTAALGLLVLIAAGAWFILRRGLRPLERMASTAGTITSGDISQRVASADGQGEVGQLGLALNTMLDELEAELRRREETEQRLRRFLSDASHELRTPLTSIRGFAELLRLDAEGQAPRPGEDGPGSRDPAGPTDSLDPAVGVRRIEEEASRMGRLVEDLLLLASLDQVRPVDRAPVDLAVLAADACGDAAATHPDRPVSLDAPEPVDVWGNGDHLRQAVGNLVSNAVQHTPPDRPIEVSAREETDARGRHAVVEVRDHGDGLSPEALDHAFDRFWRADSSRVGRSAGLGLAIVAGIAAEHGGTVRGANAADGGAVFTMRLPLGGQEEGSGAPWRP